MKFIIRAFFFFLFLFPQFANAQFYSMGQDPGNMKWRQIKNDNFKVIFPQEYEEQAKYIADVLLYAYEFGSVSLDHKPRKISVIVHNQTVVSNGFVSWAPRRMELFTTPPQTNDAHDWMESLIVHEFRHVVQVDKLNQGMTRVLSWLLGEQGTGAVLGLHVPLWFLEGDAVVAETALTNGGRGRIPSFEQGLRAQVLEKGIYQYAKAVFGSYNDFVPNHYELGYQLVANARVVYGADVWGPVLTQVARHPYSIFPFSWGMKRSAGVRTSKHYKNTMAFLDTAWTTQLENSDIHLARHISPENKLYTNYTNIHYISENEIIALKSGFADIPAVVVIDKSGEEKVLFTPGRTFQNSLSYNAGKLTWNEYKMDPRWNHRSYSDIYTYDINKKERKKVSSKTKWFAPALSNDGKYIAVVEVDELNSNSLVIVEEETGLVISRYKTAKNDFLMTPSWNDSGDEIVLIALNDKGKRIDVLDLNTGVFITLLQPSFIEISKPTYWGNNILFNGAFSGIDNIYLMERRHNFVERITSSAFGTVNASISPSGMKMVFSDYTSDGYKIGFIGTVEISPKKLDDVENNSVNFAESLAKQEEGLVTKDNIKTSEHIVKPYSKLLNLFKLHSWAPVVVDVNNQEFRPGASLLFQNELSTSFLFAGYDYDLNERRGKFFVDYNYYGFYPVMSAYFDTGIRELNYLDRQGNPQPFYFKEQSFMARTFIPLSFNINQYFYGFTPIVGYRNIQFIPEAGTPDFIQTQNIHSLEYRLYAYIYRSTVKRDMNTKLGQAIDISYRHGPFEEFNLGEAFGVRSITYLPGLMQHQSLKITAGYQEMLPGNSYYQYQSFLNYPRGIFGQRHAELKTISADYSFPLIYPDRSVKLLYLQRLSANLFFDYAQGLRYESVNNSQAEIDEEFMTCGLDVLADMHLLNVPMRIGPRMGFNPKTQQPFWDILFRITL